MLVNLNMDSYYLETIELTHNNQTFKCGLCLASATLEALKPQASLFLHPVEMEQFQHLSFEKRQFDYLIGNFTAKQAITHYAPSILVKDVFIDHGVFQHPIVFYSDLDKIQISISHSNQLCGAIAFSEKHPMAIDIEAINIDKIATIESQFTYSEKNLLKTIDHHDKLTHPTLFWTIKESLSKVLRTGLTTPLEIFEIKTVKIEGDYWISEFTNFAQYKVMSFLLRDYAFSLLYPKQSEIKINIQAMQQWMMHLK